MKLHQLNDLCRAFQDRKGYVAGLDRFLRQIKVLSILDACGGTGFPVLELAQLGWDVSYADASPEMLAVFITQMSLSNLTIPYYQCKWQELTHNIPDKFDFVLCRGNSLLYIDSWGNNEITSATKRHIKEALQQFYALLNKEGFLYIDIYPKEDVQKTETQRDFGEKLIDGKRVRLLWQIKHDFINQQRIWSPKVIVDGQTHEFCLYSYLLTHSDLVQLMREVGFSQIEELIFEGEDDYTVFLARK